MGIENPAHLLFVAVVALVVLGPKRLPRLARAVGEGVREFRQALAQGAAQSADPEAPAATVDPAEAIRSADAPDRGPL